MKNFLAKMQKHERSIAAVVFLIGILMIFFYVYAAVQYIDSETAELEQKLSAASYEGSGEIYTADYSLDIRVDDKTNEEYLASFNLDLATRTASIQFIQVPMIPLSSMILSTMKVTESPQKLPTAS